MRFPLSANGTISRRELARARFIWLPVGGMFVLYGFGFLLAARLLNGTIGTREIAFSVVLLVVGTGWMVRRPPEIGTLENHLALCSTYLFSSLAMWVIAPNGAATMPAWIFVAPVISVRLLDRRQIAAHVAAASVLMLLPIIAGQGNDATIIAALFTLPTMWALAAADTWVFEATEAQGEELEYRIRRDPLTRVGNRRLLDERLAYEIRRHARSRRTLTVIALDLNGFKALNDEIGHAAGDEALRAAADGLISAVRAQDTITRPGGDEFCVLLPETDGAAAQQVAVAIRAALLKITANGQPLTTGVGIASFPADAIEADVLLDLADERLRADKGGQPARAQSTSR
jgi:diguanylate cyclase (GGDEF)-like protein